MTLHHLDTFLAAMLEFTFDFVLLEDVLLYFYLIYYNVFYFQVKCANNLAWHENKNKFTHVLEENFPDVWSFAVSSSESNKNEVFLKPKLNWSIKNSKKRKYSVHYGAENFFLIRHSLLPMSSLWEFLLFFLLCEIVINIFSTFTDIS